MGKGTPSGEGEVANGVKATQAYVDAVAFANCNAVNALLGSTAHAAHKTCVKCTKLVDDIRGNCKTFCNHIVRKRLSALAQHLRLQALAFAIATQLPREK